MKKVVVMAMTALALVGCAPKNENPFLNYQNWNTPHGTYPFNEIKMEHYMPAIEEGMKQGLADIDAIVNNPEAPTFENTIEAYVNSGKLLDVVLNCFYNLTSAETNAEMQALEMELSPKLSEYSTTIRLNEGLFARIKAVYDQRESLTLNKEQQKLLDDIYESFADNGANLSPEDKEKYRELSARLSQLTTAYGQNVLKATNAWTKLITDEAELEGLNDDTKGMLRAKAEEKGMEGWLLDLKPTTLLPVLQDCSNRALRQEIYMASNTRCIGGEFDNTQNIIDIVNTRLEYAQLFGKKDYAEKSLHKTCAETESNVMNFLNQLRDAYMPAAREEVKEMQAYAESLGFEGGHSFGLSIAAAGYIVACLVGVIILNVLRKSGELKLSGVNSLTVLRDDHIGDSEEGDVAESIDKLSVQFAMIIIVYLATYVVTAGITGGIAKLSEGLAGTVNTLLWGFNFIIGSALAILLRVILEKMRKKGTIKRRYQDNYLLNRLSGAFFDIMIVAGIGCIDIEDIRGLVLPFILLVVAGTVVTWFHLRWVCKAVYGDYYYEGLISMYGMLTGTISSGVLLLREIDPQLETPAANNLVVGSSFGILLGAPVLILVGLAAKSNAMCFVTLGLAAAYLLILDILIFKVGRRAKAKAE